MNIRETNKAIFKDTLEQIENSKILTESVKQSIAGQEYILEGTAINVFKPHTLHDTDAKVIVSKSSTFDAARNYNGKTAVLNFASATRPGGGVTEGSSAQEECLCRCSTLYKCLTVDEANTKFYQPHRETGNALHNSDIIYTPNVTIFKSDSYNNLYQNKNVDVITCAAPNLRENPANSYNYERAKKEISDNDLHILHLNRARAILEAAANHNVDNIILGAFGCGAFKNKPEIVASAYKAALDLGLYKRCFKNIEFAIYCKESETTNYETFKKVFNA